VLLLGGLFLIWKSVKEVHEKLEDADGHATAGRTQVTFANVIVQILLLDIVFSLDSVITAVGMASQVGVMIAAVVIALGVMLVFAGSISDFVNRHPTLKMLALSFLILIGVTLVGEGLGQHIPKGYIYFSMAFAFGVEMLNLRMRSKQARRQPVELHQPYR
jgi:predicted tellurium resistance membrane protein TerC